MLHVSRVAALEAVWMMAGRWPRALLAVAKVALWVSAGLLLAYAVHRALAGGIPRP